MEANKNSIICYENEVPSFVESEVEGLYGNIFSSLIEFRIYGWQAGATSTYVARCGDKVRAIFLFERKHGSVRVLNEAIRVGREEMDCFSNYIFERYPDVHVISFKAIETDVETLPYPYQRFNHLEDITLALPDSPDAYLAALGKNTRRNIKRYGDRLRKSFPDCRFEVFTEEAIPEHHIRTLIGFNRTRMANKNIASAIDEDETRRIVALARACGVAGIMTIDGEVVAGAIAYRAGRNYFLNILAHDPRYDDHWVGFLCCYETIRECIRRGGKEFHFLWGRYDYKFALGAVQRDLDNVTIYRSRLQFLLNGRVAWRQAAEGYRRQAKVWVKYQDALLPKTIRNWVERGRDLRRMAAEMLPRGRTPA
ncbi:GNAT family N-acetyltransferase [Noviherbaspirillum aridicola]|uniref:BioF2-like acetyltransferase domain-containing protein n=1 Tax=Noviherbaspirillum aridicola TaxID=2849687 RepID=A0ABQ4Q1N4_9BURK|nr:GNAT family N-acetyltransferase [Noviherbaspirillum aridicola]GIZ51029.1 hypothetical protein NCCP691_10430 [Noviherbaspirillum aridicola]